MVGVAVLPPPAQAQKLLESYIKPMPDIKLLPPEEFEKTSTLYSEIPYGDRALAFEIRVPTIWQKQRDVSLSSASVGNKLLGEMIRYYGPAKLDSRSYLSMQAMKLDYTLTAEQWLLQYMISNSYTVQGVKITDNNRAEALYIELDKDVTYVVRMAIHINGKRIIMAKYYLPTQYWDDEKVTQAQTISTFKITNPVEEYVEPMSKYQFLDVAEFLYPETWELKSEPLRSIDRLKVGLISVASEEEVNRKVIKSLNGKMEVGLSSVYVVEDLSAELRRARGELEKSGLFMQSLIELHEDFKINPAFEAAPVEVYNLIDRENSMISYELWFVILQSGDYYYLCYLVTPSRDQDFFVWSRNTQTFRVVMSTLAPQEGSLIEN